MCQGRTQTLGVGAPKENLGSATTLITILIYNLLYSLFILYIIFPFILTGHGQKTGITQFRITSRKVLKQ